MNSLISNNLSLKRQKSTPINCKEIGIIENLILWQKLNSFIFYGKWDILYECVTCNKFNLGKANKVRQMKLNLKRN